MKPTISVVVIGHVDSGKSTLTGHLLFQLGAVSKRQMQKFEQDSHRIGKHSFAYAWIMDEEIEERSRGVTIDIGQRQIETDKYFINLIDAPGHKDFIPNMMSGAAQADVALLVVNAIEKEFEVGINVNGGQTREHLILAKALGVGQVIVAVNKMDSIGWNEERFNEIVSVLDNIISTIFGSSKELAHVPCSALKGDRLTAEMSDIVWCKKYPTIVEAIDNIRPPVRQMEGPLRFFVSDSFRTTGGSSGPLSLNGKSEIGSVQRGQAVIIMPGEINATVKDIEIDDEKKEEAPCGTVAILVLTSSSQIVVPKGAVVCDTVHPPIRVARKIKCRLMILPSVQSSPILLVKGMPIVFHCKHFEAPASVRKIINQIDKTGKVINMKPRCLVSKTFGYVVLQLDESSNDVCIETFDSNKYLSKFTVRINGQTVANGVAVEILK